MASSKRREGEGAGRSGGSGAGEPASLSFEESLSSLEGVVAQLESGDMPLEQALDAFETGVKLSRRCASTLDAAERRIEILMAERSGARPQPFAHVGRAGGSGDDGDAQADELDDGDAGPGGEGRER